MTNIKKGQMFRVGVEQYEDHRKYGLLTALQDLNKHDLIAEYLIEYPKEAKEYHADLDFFAEWLHRKGYVSLENDEYPEMWIGGYSTFVKKGE